MRLVTSLFSDFPSLETYTLDWRLLLEEYLPVLVCDEVLHDTIITAQSINMENLRKWLSFDMIIFNVF